MVAIWHTMFAAPSLQQYSNRKISTSYLAGSPKQLSVVMALLLSETISHAFIWCIALNVVPPLFFYWPHLCIQTPDTVDASFGDQSNLLLSQTNMHTTNFQDSNNIFTGSCPLASHPSAKENCRQLSCHCHILIHTLQTKRWLNSFQQMHSTAWNIPPSDQRMAKSSIFWHCSRSASEPQMQVWLLWGSDNPKHVTKHVDLLIRVKFTQSEKSRMLTLIICTICSEQSKPWFWHQNGSKQYLFGVWVDPRKGMICIHEYGRCL
jgi:hypothetical protein